MPTTIRRTSADGKRVAQYDDGTVDYAVAVDTMSSEDRMRRLGLGHLLNQPEHVQRKALLELHAQLEAKHELAKARLGIQRQPKPAPKQP